MKVIGSDGCKAGWFLVILHSDGRWKTEVQPDARSLWKTHSDAALILTDIPIGLPWQKVPVRACDIEARRLLGHPRGSSVFPAPVRVALKARDYLAACQLNEAEVGKRLSSQCHKICGKIRQMDELLRRAGSARTRIREVHPEVCFWALNNQQPMRHRKKSALGFDERLRLLQRVFPRTNDIVAQALDQFLRKDVARDDILDALVAAVTALKPEALASLPEPGQTDACGLPMEIVYRS